MDGISPAASIKTEKAEEKKIDTVYKSSKKPGRATGIEPPKNDIQERRSAAAEAKPDYQGVETSAEQHWGAEEEDDKTSLRKEVDHLSRLIEQDLKKAAEFGFGESLHNEYEEITDRFVEDLKADNESEWMRYYRTKDHLESILDDLKGKIARYEEKQKESGSQAISFSNWADLSAEDLGLDPEKTQRVAQDGEEVVKSRVNTESDFYFATIDQSGVFSVKIDGREVTGKFDGSGIPGDAIVSRIKQEENPLKDKWENQSTETAGSGVAYERLEGVEGVYVDANGDGFADKAAYYDTEGNEVVSRSLERGTTDEIENLKAEVQGILSQKKSELENLEKEGVTRTVLRQAGINPWQEDLSGGSPAAEKIAFLKKHADDPSGWQRALDTVELLSGCQDTKVSYEEAFKHYEGLQGLRNSPEKIQACADLLKVTKVPEALERIFEIPVSSANLARSGSKFTVHKIDGPLVSLKVKIKDSKVFFGIKGSQAQSILKRPNWTRRGWSMFCRPDIPLTSENIKDALDKTKLIKERYRG